MPQTEFKKKIGNKTVKIIVQSGNKNTWGVSMLCPWCGKKAESTGYSTPKQAAKWFFDDLRYHYNNMHKP